MNNANMYTEYDDRKNKIPWIRMIIVALIVAIVVFIILLLLKNCDKVSLRSDLVKAAESYYEKYPTSLPKEVGECYEVSLATLGKEGLIESNKYSTCDKTKTYVNVCYLENLRFNYAATLSCEVETTKYNMWKDGTVTDLVTGSDVRFKFTGEQYTEVEEGLTTNSVKKYYPSNTSDPNAVDRYYRTVPATGYTGKEGQATGYKWYTETTSKSYWNNGEYSAIAPTGYENKEAEKKITNYSDTRPTDASYRTITEKTLYSYRKVAAPYKFLCVVPGTSSATSASIMSPYHCALNESGFTQVEKAYYTCDGGLTDTTFGTVCADYTNWTTEACTSSATKGIECKTKTSYEYTDTVYKWYQNTTTRKYYPSNSATANGEKTYFITSPIAGAIRDDQTASQVYKYYKTISNSNVNKVKKWVEVTSGYVDLDELITTFNNLGYNVNSLSDIKALEDIRYQYKMQYRNVEE